MKRVRYIMRSAVQRASGPGDVETFVGEVDEVSEVPDEVAAMLAEAGRVEVLALVHKPTAEAPLHNPAAEKPPVQQKRRK